MMCEGLEVGGDVLPEEEPHQLRLARVPLLQVSPGSRLQLSDLARHVEQGGGLGQGQGGGGGAGAHLPSLHPPSLGHLPGHHRGRGGGADGHLQTWVSIHKEKYGSLLI